MRYTVVMEREKDGGDVVSVPALPGRVRQGDDRTQALANTRKAIERDVKDCRDAGDPVPTEAVAEFVEAEAAEEKDRRTVAKLPPERENQTGGEMKIATLVAFAMLLYGCHAQDLTSSGLQRTIGDPESPINDTLMAYELDHSPVQENSEEWIRVASNEKLNLLARELAFQAFFRRFVQVPCDFKELASHYKLRSLFAHSTLIDSTSAEAFPDVFRDDIKIGENGTGLYLWYPWKDGECHTGEETEFGVWFVTSRHASVDELLRATDDKSTPITILKTRTINCSMANLW